MFKGPKMKNISCTYIEREHINSYYIFVIHYYTFSEGLKVQYFVKLLKWKTNWTVYYLKYTLVNKQNK